MELGKSKLIMVDSLDEYLGEMPPPIGRPLIDKYGDRAVSKALGHARRSNRGPVKNLSLYYSHYSKDFNLQRCQALAIFIPYH
jgi:hypothetical protein